MKKPKKVAYLYVYNYSYESWSDWSGNVLQDLGLKAFVAPNDDFMTSIFYKGNSYETFKEDGSGDYNEFGLRDNNGGIDEWKLKKKLKLTQEELEGLGMNLEDFKKNVKTPLEDLSAEDLENLFFENFEIEDFDEATYNKLFFDARSIVEPFKGLFNDQLDSLIKALESFKK